MINTSYHLKKGIRERERTSRGCSNKNNVKPSSEVDVTVSVKDATEGYNVIIIIRNLERRSRYTPGNGREETYLKNGIKCDKSGGRIWGNKYVIPYPYTSDGIPFNTW